VELSGENEPFPFLGDKEHRRQGSYRWARRPFIGLCAGEFRQLLCPFRKRAQKSPRPFRKGAQKLDFLGQSEEQLKAIYNRSNCMIMDDLESQQQTLIALGKKSENNARFILDSYLNTA